MTAFTIAVGAVLTLTGIAFYVGTGAVSLTALIPSLIGVLILVGGLLATKEPLRKHAIHASLAVALLGALGSLMNVAKTGDLIAGTAERPAAIVASLILFVLTVVYVAAGVRSFVRARRSA